MKIWRMTVLAAAIVSAAIMTACAGSEESAVIGCESEIYTAQDMDKAFELISERCEKTETKIMSVEYMGDSISAKHKDKQGFDEYMGFMVKVSTPNNRLRDIVSDSSPRSYTEETERWWFAKDENGEWVPLNC